MPLEERIGLDDLPDAQEIWRFLDRRKVSDLTQSGSLRLSRVSELRKIDVRESRLPSVLGEVLQRVVSSERARNSLVRCPRLAKTRRSTSLLRVGSFPDLAKKSKKCGESLAAEMKAEYGSIQRFDVLLSSLPSDIRRSFGVGRIRYIRDDISYPEVLELGQYQSMPFLLKLEDHINEREVRLFERRHLPQLHWEVQQEQPPCTRFRITDTDLINSIAISPICPSAIAKDITEELVQWRFPKELIGRESV